jgi:hypothetical protein
MTNIEEKAVYINVKDIKGPKFSGPLLDKK